MDNRHPTPIRIRLNGMYAPMPQILCASFQQAMERVLQKMQGYEPDRRDPLAITYWMDNGTRWGVTPAYTPRSLHDMDYVDTDVVVKHKGYHVLAESLAEWRKRLPPEAPPCPDWIEIDLLMRPIREAL